MDETADFASLVAGLRAGDEAAAVELYRRYGPAIRLAARRALDRTALRSRYDSVDFVQEAWVRLLTLPDDHPALGSHPALRALLVQVARGKVADAVRHHRAEVARTAPPDEPADPEADGPDSPAPPPVETVIADEAWVRMLVELPPGHRAALTLLRDGYTHAEVADRVDLSTRTVERIVARMRDVHPAIDAVLRAAGRQPAGCGRARR